MVHVKSEMVLYDIVYDGGLFSFKIGKIMDFLKISVIYMELDIYTNLANFSKW